jgi:Holliday junction resolvase-like predicted endonuclease
MFWGMNPRQQGDLGEAAAQHWLIRQGYTVFAPIGHSPDVDMIAMRGDESFTVQVKTCAARQRGRWLVSVCTRGGNQSWNKIVKRFGAERCDRLFVLTADGRQWFMPATSVEGTTSILLGGPKYAEFEVEPGYPFLVAEAA